jgi:hypothetical protein
LSQAVAGWQLAGGELGFEAVEDDLEAELEAPPCSECETGEPKSGLVHQIFHGHVRYAGFRW